MDALTYLDIKAAKKLGLTFPAFDLADFLADHGEEEKTPALWGLSWAEIVPLFFERIENGLASDFLVWAYINEEEI